MKRKTTQDVASEKAARFARRLAARRIAALFRRNGYVRWCDLERRAEVGAQAYKKGYEARLVASSRRELSEMRRLLRLLGFKVGRPFRKGRQYRQPIYGRFAVERLLQLVATPPSPKDAALTATWPGAPSPWTSSSWQACRRQRGRGGSRS